MGSLEQLNQRFEAAAEGAPPFKDQTEGDQLGGTITAIGSFTHAEFGTSPVLTIDCSQEEAGTVVLGGKPVKDAASFRFSMFGAVLASFYEEQQPKVGDWVAFRYLGKQKPQNSAGKPYNNWACVLEPATASTKLDDAAGDASDFG